MCNNSQMHLSDKLNIVLCGNAIHPAGIRGSGQEQLDIAVEAVIQFTERNEKRAIIIHQDNACEALLGQAGTHLIK